MHLNPQNIYYFVLTIITIVKFVQHTIRRIKRSYKRRLK